MYCNCGSDLSEPTAFQGLAKVDTVRGTETRWLPRPYEYLGEPVFAARKKRDGELLSFM